MLKTIKENINSFSLIKNSNYTLVSISLGKFLYGFYTAAIGLSLIPIGEIFNINLKVQSIVFPFNYLGQIVIIFFVGYIADRLGKKIIHTILLILMGISALIFTYLSSYYLFLILFFFMGVFSSSINLLSDASITDTFKKNKGFYLNIAHCFFGLGAMTSPIVFNLVFSRTNDFRTIYFVLFLIAFFILFFITLAPYPLVDDEEVQLNLMGTLLRKQKFLFLCIYMILASGTQHAISGWIPTLFSKYLNFPQGLSNYSLAFYWAAIVIGRIITAFLSKKFNEMSILKVINILMFILIFISFFTSSPLVLLIDYSLLGLVIGGFFPLIIAFSSEIYRKHSTTRLAVLFASASVGMLLVPTFTGFFGYYFAIHKVLSFTSIFFFVYIYIFYKKYRTT